MGTIRGTKTTLAVDKELKSDQQDGDAFDASDSVIPDLVPSLCTALDGSNQGDFIVFQKGFLDDLDTFEVINEDWDGENEDDLFTGNTCSAMAWHVVSNWEPLPVIQEVDETEPELRWHVMPEVSTPVIYNLHVPNFDSLNKFIPHDPKKKGAKKVKTDAERQNDFHKYWIKPSHYMKEEDDMHDDLWDDDPYSIFDDWTAKGSSDDSQGNKTA